MRMHKSLAMAVMMAAAAVAWAAPTLSTEYRYASQVSEWFVRGDAATSQSNVFQNGLRLAAWDGQNEQDVSRVAVATAVYFFQIPSNARSITVDVAYRVDDAARDRKVAGFLFVRDTSVEQQNAGQDANADPNDEPGFQGATYMLPADQVQTQVTLSAANTVVDGVLEVHLSAGAGQVFDAQYIQVKSYGAPLPVRVETVASSSYIANPYDYTYYYYYTGPCYWPHRGYYARFYTFDTVADPFWWGGWWSFRACFYTYHSWHYRPRHYVHFAPIVLYRPVFVVRPWLTRHRHDWYRRHFRYDDRYATDRDIRTHVRQRVRVVSSDRLRDYRVHARQVADNIKTSDRDLRTKLGDRYQDRVRQWRERPSQARVELPKITRTEAVRRASTDWRTVNEKHVRVRPPQKVDVRSTPTRTAPRQPTTVKRLEPPTRVITPTTRGTAKTLPSTREPRVISPRDIREPRVIPRPKTPTPSLPDTRKRQFDEPLEKWRSRKPAESVPRVIPRPTPGTSSKSGRDTRTPARSPSRTPERRETPQRPEKRDKTSLPEPRATIRTAPRTPTRPAPSVPKAPTRTKVIVPSRPSTSAPSSEKSSSPSFLQRVFGRSSSRSSNTRSSTPTRTIEPRRTIEPPRQISPPRTIERRTPEPRVYTPPSRTESSRSSKTRSIERAPRTIEREERSSSSEESSSKSYSDRTRRRRR